MTATDEHLRLQWFTKAGFKDVKIKRIGPKWYRGVRRHGLIMGCSVTGIKPKVLSSLIDSSEDAIVHHGACTEDHHTNSKPQDITH